MPKKRKDGKLNRRKFIRNGTFFGTGFVYAPLLLKLSACADEKASVGSPPIGSDVPPSNEQLTGGATGGSGPVIPQGAGADSAIRFKSDAGAFANENNYRVDRYLGLFGRTDHPRRGDSGYVYVSFIRNSCHIKFLKKRTSELIRRKRMDYSSEWSLRLLFLLTFSVGGAFCTNEMTLGEQEDSPLTGDNSEEDGSTGNDLNGDEQAWKTALAFAVPEGYADAKDYCEKYIPTMSDEEATRMYAESYPLSGSVPQGYARGCIGGDSPVAQLARSLPWNGKTFHPDGTVVNVMENAETGEIIEHVPGTWHIGESWYNHDEKSIIVEYPPSEKWDPIFQQITGGILGSFSSYRDEIREIKGKPGFFIGRMYLRPNASPNNTPDEVFTLHFVLMQLETDSE